MTNNNLRITLRVGAIAGVAFVTAAAFPEDCDLFDNGACITGDSLYFCENDSLDKCQNFWCDTSVWTYCGYFRGSSCDDVGLPADGSSETFAEPFPPDWSVGTPNGGSAGGGGSGGCAFYDPELNRILCEQRDGASSCSGNFFGGGSSCAGLDCPLGSTDPFSCSVPGGGGGGGNCTSSYAGPTGDVQVSSQCASVWNYRCQQGDDNAADQNCLVYASLEATEPCPYCP